jgi:hemolysin activation/secretion protein
MRRLSATLQTAATRLAFLPAAALLAVSTCGSALAAEEDPPTSEAPASAVESTPPAAEAPPAANANDAPKGPAPSEFHGSIELNNQYSPDTDPLRATLALSYTNLFSTQDETSALYQVAPQDPHQVGVFATTYVAHPLPDGLQPSVYFIDSNSNVPVSDTAGVLGKGQVLGLRLSHALGAATQTLTVGIDYKHFRNTTGFDDGSSSSTPVSYLNLSLAYAGRWTSAERDAAVTVSANYGPNGGASAANAYADGDFHERADYFYVRADGEFVETLPKGLRLYLRLAGQYTGQSLIIDEDYPVAGSDGVRGYLEAEVLGDRALKSTVQLQSPPWQHGARQVADAFVFFDAAVAEVLEPLPGESMRMHPRSWGLGVDLAPWKNITGSLTWARPLVDGDFTHAGESRLLFLLRASF